MYRHYDGVVARQKVCRRQNIFMKELSVIRKITNENNELKKEMFL
jgi:hypothetical protein